MTTISTTNIATSIQMMMDCRPDIFMYSQVHAAPVTPPKTAQKPSQSAKKTFISPFKK
jgi:hypothetical protein